MTDEPTNLSTRSREDEILMTSSDDEDHTDTQTSKNAEEKLTRLIDGMLTIFEERVLNLTESKFPQYIFLFLSSISKRFL
jgi:hypothetical protein